MHLKVLQVASGLQQGLAPADGLVLCADLPYGWDFLVENLMDPSHVAFSHHGILGKRYALLPHCYQLSLSSDSPVQPTFWGHLSVDVLLMLVHALFGSQAGSWQFTGVSLPIYL